MSAPAPSPAFAQIAEDFALLEDWEDRYRHIIELGRSLDPLPKSAYDDANKVRGCASQVWLVSEVYRDDQGAIRLRFRGDSDAHIVRGLIAILIALYTDKTPEDILATDAKAALAELELDGQLSPQRSNGLASMVNRIRADATAAAAGAVDQT
ncbi:MAG: SufE family protein [Parvularculaceae bacterium]